jgi:hypothetical protein
MLVEPMFDGAAAVRLPQAGRCACAGCSADLGEPEPMKGDWRFCRRCRCAWKVTTVNGVDYAAMISGPMHAKPITGLATGSRA